MKKLSSEVLRWIATGFFIVSAIIFLPSFASALLLAAAILTAPLPFLDEIIRDQIHLKKTARIAIVTIIFFAGVMITPTAEMSRSNVAEVPSRTVTSQTQPSIKQTTDDDNEAAALQETPADEEDPVEESAPTAEASAQDTAQEPTAAAVAEPGPAPAETTPAQEAVAEPVTPAAPVEETPTYVEPESNTQGYTVYITETGEKYHRAGCRHLKDSQIAIDVNTAISRGYTACKTCGG